MVDKGRPRKITPQTELAKRFLELYLDPINKPDRIRQICGISLSTYYKYENELAIPQLTVGLGSSSIQVIQERRWNLVQRPEEIEELNMIRKVSSLMQIRMKLIPFLTTNIHTKAAGLRTQQFDLVIDSIAKTKVRSREFYFSQNYLLNDAPSGVLIRIRHSLPYTVRGSDKPLLGVSQGSIHEEYALEKLAPEFNVRSYRTISLLFEGLRKAKIDFVLNHPSWIKILNLADTDFEICSKRYVYGAISGIMFRRDTALWVDPVNQALEQLFNSSLRK